VQGAWYLARTELRRRWQATLVLAALVGLTGGVLLTTVAGARRSSTAYERFREETRAADLDIAFDGEPTVDIDEAKARVGALPDVTVVTQTAFPFIVPAGSGFYPYLDFLAIVGLDDEFGSTIDRPRLVDGRMPDAERPEEIAVLADYGRKAGVRVGDELAFESFAPEQLMPLFDTGDAGPPAGPEVDLVVTGVFDAPTFISESSGAFQPKVLLSPAFVEAHGDQVATYPGGVTVRLRDGAADVAATSAAVRELFADEPNLELTPASEVDAKIDSSIDVIVTALALTALVAGIAGTVAMAQALGRHLAPNAMDGHPLASLGMVRRERVVAQVVAVIPAAIGGALLAVAVAVAASPIMPLGVARRAEPDPGIAVDGWALAVGFVGITVVVTALAAAVATLTGRRATQLTAAEEEGVARRPSRLLGWTALPPEASIGVGLATTPRRGTAWAVRSGLAGIAFGVTGLVAVVVFAASVTSLVRSPDDWGAPFDALVSSFSGDLIGEHGDELLDDPEVARLGVLTTGLARIDGDEVNSHAFEPLKGGMSLTLLSGRLPEAPGEVVLGTSTERDAGTGVGEEVRIDGAEDSVRATVVGLAAFPVIDERSSPGRGVLLWPDDLVAISSDTELNNDVMIDWAPGVDAAAANEALVRETETEVSAPRLPSDVNNLDEVERLPWALAAFLAVIGALAAVHALVSTVRLRRRELAVLRALGFQRWQLGATLAWQATSIAVIGLVVGIPLGLVAGRLVWGAVARGIGVADHPVTPALAIGVVVVAALAVANLAAVLPGRSAARVRAAAVLRAG
jgi:hypothetical protein